MVRLGWRGGKGGGIRGAGCEVGASGDEYGWGVRIAGPGSRGMGGFFGVMIFGGLLFDFVFGHGRQNEDAKAHSSAIQRFGLALP